MFFWAMVLPLVPLFLMIFGHEAWRRICPLSALMQIPRFLELHYRKWIFNSKTGLPEAKLNLIGPDHWLARNAWLFQFGLLSFGLTLRLLLINSDRAVFGSFFIAVILIAITIGYFFGGKTWCQYICPISPVQRIYSGPGGLLESKAYNNPTLITKSMCRTVKPDKSEVTACVSCVRNCPDIDLEKSYWADLANPQRKFVYYGYSGLVLGFYTYYYLYAGNWDYYMSGAWTHESNVSASLLAPGFFFFGQPVAFIPKLIAAPLSLGVFIFGAYGLWRGVEAVYRRLRRRLGLSDDAALVTHQMLSTAAFVTINIFYLFGGRPTLLRLPEAVQVAVSMFVVFASSIWYVGALQRSPGLYLRESLAKVLIRQLKSLAIDFSKLLEGRSVDELKVDEVYVLAKALPGVSNDERRNVYKAMLRDVLATGKASSSQSLELLREMRHQVDISEREHAAFLLELGVEDPALVDPDQRISEETYVRISGYRDSVKALILETMQNRHSNANNAVDAETDQLDRLRMAYNISVDESREIIGSIVNKDAILIQRFNDVLAMLVAFAAQGQALLRLEIETQSASVMVLQKELQKRRTLLTTELLNLLPAVQSREEQAALALSLRLISDDILDGIIGEAESPDTVNAVLGSLPDQVHDILTDVNPPLVSRSSTSLAKPLSYRDIAALDLDPLGVIESIARGSEPSVAAVALWTLALLDPARARGTALQRTGDDAAMNWLLRETQQRILGEDSADRSPSWHSGEHYTVLDAGTVARLLWLSDVPMFKNLDIDVLANIARDVEVRAYRQATELCVQGDAPTELYVMHDGQADTVLQTAGGEKFLGHISPGEVVGELGALTKSKRAATVRITSERAVVLALGAERLSKFIDSDLYVSRSILLTVCERLQETLAQV